LLGNGDGKSDSSEVRRRVWRAGYFE